MKKKEDKNKWLIPILVSVSIGLVTLAYFIGEKQGEVVCSKENVELQKRCDILGREIDILRDSIESLCICVVDTLNIGDIFYPSYMGCINNIDINRKFSDNTRSDKTCYKIAYQRNCTDGWAGVYWLNRDGNWGQYQGMDLSKKQFSKVTFWARGEIGNETVKFGSGGVNDPKFPNKDSYDNPYGLVKLTKEWKQYTINLQGTDLSSVIGAFFWSANWEDNNTGLTFYLADILFE